MNRPVLSDPAWCITRDGFDTKSQNHLETLFALSNGSLGVRGCLAEHPGGCRAGTFAAGVYDRDESFTWDMVNLPDFGGMRIVAGNESFGVDTATVVSHARTLDMAQGLVYRRSELRTASGRTLRWESWRFVSVDQKYVFAERHALTPLDFDGTLAVTMALDAGVDNYDCWQFYTCRHLDRIRFSTDHHRLLVAAKLAEHRFPVGCGMSVAASCLEQREVEQDETSALLRGTIAACRGQTCFLDRFATVASFRERNAGEPRVFATLNERLDAAQTATFDTLLRDHGAAMQRLWARADVNLEGDDALLKQLRYNIFHLLQAGPRHDQRVSIGAKGLTGERYSGHVYWDTEMFMLPFYVFTDPATARNILLYRYHMLAGARATAAMYNQEGARYPYKSADQGFEALPYFQPHGWCWDKDEKIGVEKNWFAEKQIHIGSAVMRGMMLYYQATGDTEFMIDYGLEMLFEVARFWASYVEWIPENERFEILDVMGPDEFHPRVDNNAYINYLTAATLRWALEMHAAFTESNADAVTALCARIGLTAAEIDTWNAILEKLYLPRPDGRGIIEECDEFFALPDFDKGDNDVVMHWGPVENAVGETVTRREKFQVVKQCDLVLLFFLFPDMFDRSVMEATYDYYERRTLHTSSLSPNTASAVALRLGKGASAYHYLDVSSRIDLDDLQGNTDSGIHSAGAGGTWMAAVFGFAGITMNTDFTLDIQPRLPEQWKRFQCRFFWKGRLLELELTRSTTRIALREGAPVELSFRGKRVCIDGSHTFGNE